LPSLLAEMEAVVAVVFPVDVSVLGVRNKVTVLRTGPLEVTPVVLLLLAGAAAINASCI